MPDSRSGSASAGGWRGHGFLAGLVLSLGLAWANFLTTSRWASEPGALHGWRAPWYGAALTALSVAVLVALARALRPRRQAVGGGAAAAPTAGPGTGAPVGARLVLALGAAWLAAAFVSAFPVSTWRAVPFYDDWPGLLQLSVNGADLLARGAATGWNWSFLGGYHTSSDLSQSLAATGIIPFRLLGPNVGFHVMLAVFTLLVPLAVWADLRLARDERLTWLATGLACVLTAGYFATIMRSGMANSVAGVGFSGLALAGSHAARLGRRWGGPLMVAALTLVLYSHAAFFAYTAVLLGLEALYYRSWRMAFRSGAALTAAFAAALPLHWELVQYPEFFRTNNLYWDAPPRFDWPGFLRQVFYAAQVLVQPWRWFNDYTGAAAVWLPALAATAVLAPRDRSRAGFYAWSALATVALLRLNTPQLGIILAREMFLYPLLLGPALALFVTRLPGRTALGPLVLVTLGLFVAVPFAPVPHLPDVRAFNPWLVDRIRTAPGHMVLIENNPHWDLIAADGQRSEKSPFDVHYEALLPEMTGKRFFGQPQDGYHRSTFRDRVVAGGAYRGRAIGETSADALADELRRWGVTRLFTWSAPTRAHLAASRRFVPVAQDGPWQEFALQDADPRQVVTDGGTGVLAATSALDATVRLQGVRAGTTAVVRTNYYPAWSASCGGRDVPLFARDGQLAFLVPADGTYDVHLRYARRVPLTLASLAFAAIVAAALWAGLFGESRQRRTQTS